MDGREFQRNVYKTRQTLFYNTKHSETYRETRRARLDRSNSTHGLTPARARIMRSRILRSRPLRTRSSVVISRDMEHALVVLLSHLSHIVALIVGRSPAIVFTSLIRVFAAVEPAYRSETADECATADDDESNGSSCTERHNDGGM